MHLRAVLVCCLCLAAPGRPASVPGWTSAVQQDYEALLRDVQRQRWEHGESVEPSEAELKLATFSAAMLTRMTGSLDHYDDIQRRLQLQRHTVQVNLGRVELDTLLASYRAGGDVRMEELSAAFKNYMEMQKKMASSLGMESVDELWWSPFETSSGSARSQLETMWSQTASLVSDLTAYLQSLPAPAAESLENLILACAAQGDCATLTKMALPYPDISAALTNLLREKHMTAEALARLADQFLALLGLPAAPASLWEKSQFGSAAACADYADAEKVRVCADGTEAGLRKALALMTDSEYLRSAASQEPPFQTPAFPGFERAVSSAVDLLALQPSLVQQLVYGYGTGRGLAPVSLYLSRGGRPVDRPDPLCRGDIACQQTANALMQAAVSRLLALGYHMGSLHWLESEAAAPSLSAARWRAAVGGTLGLAVTAAPVDVDARFYEAGRHAGRALAGLAAFQIRAAACPRGGDCLPTGAAAAGDVLRRVMAAGSSAVWDATLSEATGGAAPSAAALLDFFAPLRSLVQPRRPQQPVLRTLELEDEGVDRRRARHHFAVDGSALAQLSPDKYCAAVKNKTVAETALCDWNDDFDDKKRNLTDTEWDFGLDVSMVAALAESKRDFLASRNASRRMLPEDVDEWIWPNTTDDNEKYLRGEMFVLSEKDVGAAQNNTLLTLTTATSELVSKYIGVMVCPFDKQKCNDNEKFNIWDLQAAMAGGSLSDDELMYYWREYRAAAKTELAGTFQDYLNSGKQAAQEAGLDHYGQFQLIPYGYGDKNQTLLEELAVTWKEGEVSLDDMYTALHTYVRYKLLSSKDRKPIPSEQLGEMFAEDWRNIYDSTAPYDNSTLNITEALEAANYTIVMMRDDAVTFLSGLGLRDLSKNTEFMNKSKWSACTSGRDCEALAWTSGNSDEVRLRMTPEVTMDNYELVHSKAAELEYYLHYSGRDPEFRAPANPAFTEAVAGAISLSVLTPSHLKAKKLWNGTVDHLVEVDYLYRRALQYLAPLPFSYVAQQWQWRVYNGSLTSDNWERQWWELRENMQGVRPAEIRDKDDADPLAVPTLVRDRPAFQRYLATLLQFQLYERFCLAAGKYDPDDADKPLHLCDLTGIPQKDMADMMALGNSQRWRQVVEDYTVNGTVSADAMLTYFEPLHGFLAEFIKEYKLESGWDSDLDDYWDADETDDATVPIVVGVVLGVLVLIVLIAYFVVRVRRNRAE